MLAPEAGLAVAEAAAAPDEVALAALDEEAATEVVEALTEEEAETEAVAITVALDGLVEDEVRRVVLLAAFEDEDETAVMTEVEEEGLTLRNNLSARRISKAYGSQEDTYRGGGLSHGTGSGQDDEEVRELHLEDGD
jgi:hypothetical protein